MRTGGVGAHYVEVSKAQAGNHRLEKDLNGALRAGREDLAAIIFLGEVNARCDDLFHGDIRLGRITQGDVLSGTFRIDRRFAEIKLSSRNLESSWRSLGE